MLKKEYVTEEMEKILRMLCFLLFNKNFDNFEYDKYEFFGEAATLKSKLEQLIDDEKICDAEDLLFDEIESKNKNREENIAILQVALWFYLKLNEYDEKYLKKRNFSKNEILDGLKEIEGFVGGKFN